MWFVIVLLYSTAHVNVFFYFFIFKLKISLLSSKFHYYPQNFTIIPEDLMNTKKASKGAKVSEIYGFF